MTLTHQDQRELNKKARAHGLPDLWPEAEEVEAVLKIETQPGWPFGGGVGGGGGGFLSCTCHHRPHSSGFHYVGCPHYTP